MKNLKKFSVVLSLFLLFICFSPAISSQTLEIFFYVPDTLVSTGEENGLLSIYIDNFNYEIFGFQVVLKSENPDLVKFDFSNGGFDTSGTLISGFELVFTEDLAGDQSELWFYCIADISWIQGSRDGFFPQTGGVAVKIPYTTTNAPDTNFSLTSLISVNPPFDFSDPLAYSIGVVSDTTYDSTFFECTYWTGEICQNWIIVEYPLAGYDSLYVDTTINTYLDTNQVKWHDGSITLDLLNCDIDGSGDLDIEDLVCLVDFMFLTYDPQNCPLLHCDNDYSNSLDIADLVYLVEYMFNGGPPPPK